MRPVPGRRAKPVRLSQRASWAGVAARHSICCRSKSAMRRRIGAPHSPRGASRISSSFVMKEAFSDCTFCVKASSMKESAFSARVSSMMSSRNDPFASFCTVPRKTNESGKRWLLSTVSHQTSSVPISLSCDESVTFRSVLSVFRPNRRIVCNGGNGVMSSLSSTTSPSLSSNRVAEACRGNETGVLACRRNVSGSWRTTPSSVSRGMTQRRRLPSCAATSRK